MACRGGGAPNIGKHYGLSISPSIVAGRKTAESIPAIKIDCLCLCYVDELALNDQGNKCCRPVRKFEYRAASQNGLRRNSSFLCHAKPREPANSPKGQPPPDGSSDQPSNC